MNQSFILASGVREHLLIEGLMDFANLYRIEAFAQNISIFREKGELNYLVLFADAPRFEHFAFAVNAIRHIKQKDQILPTVSGYFLNEPGEATPYFLTQGVTKVYVSEIDEERDNVNAVTQNGQTFYYSFGGRVSDLAENEQAFEVPDVDLENFHHLIDVIPAPEHTKNKPWWKIW